ncbi:DeoR/GlpR transcriptional regulator [Dickeya oryzae]|uniref:DeoR/GlpR family DNA-binding transcription regulator n=1 Tax=Dickeya oryzae TaxID=1240404 RepID=A0AB39IM13_9GAMM|nr:DeoR/GlpR family DNA-binding transcription regulator [Dickeya oryzae]MBP2859302.1 DeoR/GlpR transcriptional regulator [Dickeya oryzae]MCA6993525.1 DeoR/GlpR family DNA-binding transcription regulator [Dickeya oryzae]
MLEETRLHRIRLLLSSLNRVSTDHIIQHLGVSRETVRRDVLKLEAQGVLRRVHGGIVATDVEPEPPLSVRNTVRELEKRAIAQLAAQQIKAGQTLFIDAGSTTTLLAAELLVLPGMTIITNSLNVALTLTATETDEHAPHEVILLGGHMGAAAQATSGALTVTEIQRYRADIALLSPVGIASQSGASSFSHHEAAIAGAMSRNARQRIMLADHSKIGVTSRVIYAAPTDIDLLITDSGSSSNADFPALQAVCAQVLLA